ncbi:alpha/beta fold hydrolase [Sphingopyxis panaciterrulae]|uniref:Pimeloyl-ACP methyl ester carboxylesterase n=1 Tax=Sphingopyxis panaciterrulae TaxID=462372 RepID=A0A7W9ETY7_9SPHN|nr:alpha/beta hydrolase [Sphingopyxis panaciterrulae]MBB5708705.1 pimeloyl-ACP methyl ester carboxylesterase [Sphingopyxis panaciterrulae]
MIDHQEHRITAVDGVEIAYVTFGEGRPLLISHGGFTIADEWFATARPLAAGRQVAIVERRGRGRSGDAPAHSLDREIDDLAAVVTALGGDVDLFGHSYGGALSLGYALRTGFEGKLILYEPTTAVAALVGGDKLAPVKALFDDGRTEEALVLLYTSVLRMPVDFVEATRGTPAWDHHHALLGSFLREVAALDGFAPTIEDCAALTAPTALLLGSMADQWTRNNAAGLVQRLAGMTLLPVHGQSHFAHLTDPTMLAALVAETLDMLARD